MAIEEGVARGLDGVRGLVADRKAYGQRTLGWGLEQRLGLLTWGPRTSAGRHAWAVGGQPQSPLPLRLEKPGRTRPAPPRRWQGASGVRPVEVAYADGRRAVEALRFRVVPSRQVAQPVAVASSAAQAKEAERVAEPSQRVAARWFAWAADAAAALSASAGRGQGRRGRQPPLGRSPALHYRVEAVRAPKKRPRRGRPPKAEAPQGAVR
jgi:hypothetical protein